MWFTGNDGSKMRIGYATSIDGVVWNKSAGNPVLDVGADGSFDDAGVSNPTVLLDGALYQIWFTGNDGSKMRIGYATSTDGVVRHKSAGNPVLNLGANGFFDDEGVSSPAIMSDGILTRMFYAGYDGSTSKIGYAVAQGTADIQLGRVTITPANSTVAMWGNQSFTARGFDQSGNLIQGATYTWTLATAGAGILNTTIGQTVIFTATGIGMVNLQVKVVSGTQTDTDIATITVVNGQVARIDIEPTTATIDARGSVSFTAKAYNQYGYELTGITGFTWQVAAGSGSVQGSPGKTVILSTTDDIGKLTFFAGSKTGKLYITAEVEGKKATATVTITPGPIEKLVFVPPTAGTLTVGMPVEMTVQTQDGFGNPAATDTTITVNSDNQSSKFAGSSGAMWCREGTFNLVGTSNIAFLFKQNGTITLISIIASIQGTTITATHLVTIQLLGSSSSGMVVADDGKTKIEVGTGTLIGEGYIEINTTPGTTTAIEEANKKEEINLRINRVEGTLRQFALQGVSIGTGTKVTMGIPYPDADNDGYVDGVMPLMRETSLEIYRLVGTDTEASWVRIPACRWDTQNNIVYAEVFGFSFYILMGAGFEATLEEAFAYPNPYYADRHDGIYFDKLTENSVIQIFTIAGELVREIEVRSPREEWDVRNSAGQKVASGIYIYLIKDPAGNKKVGKTGVLR